ncbi:MAG: GntR family transcriptional regulator [Deltaproteobacteria bacterium]|nr:GntR family transcriptional regulator [Deltaproteobacteria bacterium]
MDEVRRALVVGTLLPEDALPSVRQLAAELRVNPNTVQQAYRELEREGVVTKRRGLGTFAASIQMGEKERQMMARELAQRMLREAYRQGLSAQELLAALEAVASDRREDSSEEDEA